MEFKNYNKLPSELRDHALSYNDNKTLENYAPCSKLCNEEVQRRNTQFLWSIKMAEIRSGVQVIVRYESPTWTSYRVLYLTVDGKKHKMGSDSTYVYDGDAQQAAMEYVKNRLKYARTGNPRIIEIDMSVWPSSLLKTPGIEVFPVWDITFDEDMYQQFYEAVTETPLLNKELTLRKCKINPRSIPAQIYNTEFFQNLKTLNCVLIIPELPVNSFLTMKATSMRMDARMFPWTVINQKISQWFSNPPDNKLQYLFDQNIDEFKLSTAKDTILKNLPVKHLEERQFRVECHLEHETGIKAIINITPLQITFTTHMTSFTSHYY